MSSEQLKIFIPETPVEFTSSLLSQLDAATESNYTREQYAEAYIQQQVHKELKKLESNKLSNMDSKLNNSLHSSDIGDNKSKVSNVESINDKLSQVSQGLDDIKFDSPKKLEKLTLAEKKLSSCLKNNTGKPLNCWNEVQAFNNLVDHF